VKTIPVSRPLITEGDIDTVKETLSKGLLSGDTIVVKEFENNFASSLGVKNAILVNSGTSALDLLYDSLSIRPGDKWVLPTFTITATINNLIRRGAVVFLADADEETWSMNLEDVEVTDLVDVSGVMVTHIYGLSANFGQIRNAVGENINIYEDAAEVLGATYNNRFCGTLGRAGIFSFYANKVITCGEGGAIVTDDDELAERLRYLRNLCFGSERFVHEELGWNYRVPSMSAALLSSQLTRLQEIVGYKIQIANRYIEGLQTIPYLTPMSTETSFSRNTFWVVPMLVSSNSPISRGELQRKLQDVGVETRRFFCPIHLQPYVKRYNISVLSEMRVSENLWSNGLYLPSGVGITFDEVDFVIQRIKEIFNLQ